MGLVPSSVAAGGETSLTASGETLGTLVLATADSLVVLDI